MHRSRFSYISAILLALSLLGLSAACDKEKPQKPAPEAKTPEKKKADTPKGLKALDLDKARSAKGKESIKDKIARKGGLNTTAKTNIAKGPDAKTTATLNPGKSAKTKATTAPLPKTPPPPQTEPIKETPKPTPKPSQPEKKNTPAKKPTLSVSGLLNRSMVKKSTGFKGVLRPTKLRGVKASETYNSIRLESAKKGGDFGVALQVWKEKNPGAQSRRFNNLLRQYPGTSRKPGLGDSAFVASWSGVQYVVWLDRKEKYIAALTCGDSICSSEIKSMALAKEIKPKIKVK